MLDVNLHFLGCAFLRNWNGKLEHPVAEVCVDIFGLHALGKGHREFSGSVSELAMKEVALLGFVVHGADEELSLFPSHKK
jgi:hypothetical protein